MKKYSYAFAALAFLSLKGWQRNATPEDLSFLLAPVDTIISVVTGDTGQWLAGAGYYHAQADILIDASCAGFNFFLIAFLASCAILLRHRDAPWIVPAALLMAWPATLIANASRILTLMLTGRMGPDWLAAAHWHELQGAFVYLFFLVTFYLLARHLTHPKPQMA